MEVIEIVASFEMYLLLFIYQLVQENMQITRNKVTIESIGEGVGIHVSATLVNEDIKVDAKQEALLEEEGRSL